MESLTKISKMNIKIEDTELQKVSGGKKLPDYSNTWWWVGFDALGQIAEAGSGAWTKR